MVKVSVSVHPRGLNPFQSAKAWFLRKKLKQSWAKVRFHTRTVGGKRPGQSAAEDAVARVGAQKGRADGIAKLNYGNCGRLPLLSESDKKRIVEFVKRWRAKRFCTSPYIRSELKLKCGVRTIQRALNEAGFFWRPAPRKQKLSPEQLAKRKAFVDKYVGKTSGWWVENFGLVLDGVTLTLAPKPLSAKEKHAAQAITHMWVKRGEALDNNLHTLNRYGVQLGKKVPLWGGFTGDGEFTLKLWTDRPKLDKDIWARHVGGAVKEAAANRNIWHDNEGFLKQPDVYAKHRLVMRLFPPNSGDLNPIENVWADLRRELAAREFEDLRCRRTLSVSQFRQRVAQVLHSFSVPKRGEQLSKLQKYVEGMPGRLRRCRANAYGRCGK